MIAQLFGPARRARGPAHLAPRPRLTLPGKVPTETRLLSTTRPLTVSPRPGPSPRPLRLFAPRARAVAHRPGSGERGEEGSLPSVSFCLCSLNLHLAVSFPLYPGSEGRYRP